MKIALKIFSLALLLLGLAAPLSAQVTNPIMMESGETIGQEGPKGEVINDIVKDRMIMDKRVLPYDHIREADILWEKWVWRVIDIREKMNL